MAMSFLAKDNSLQYFLPLIIVKSSIMLVNLLIKASLYMYSTPKYKANDVKVKTKAEQINERVSIQKIKCESIRSKQKNQRPKSK